MQIRKYLARCCIKHGKRGRENQSRMKKSMLRLAVTAADEEYFELNKEARRSAFHQKSHGRP